MSCERSPIPCSNHRQRSGKVSTRAGCVLGARGIPKVKGVRRVGQLPAADNRDEMNVPAANREHSVTVPVLAGAIDRSPVLWPLVVAALLMPTLAIATAAGFGLL